MDTYSPAAIENEPDSRPAVPASMITVCDAPEPATPMTSAVLDTSPSLTPKTPARNAPERSPRCHGSLLAICARGLGRPPSISLAIVRA